MKKIVSMILLQLCILSPLAAQNLRMEIGAEKGNMPLDQGNRMRNDVMITEVDGRLITNPPIYMTPFSSKSHTSPYIRLRAGWDLSWAEAFAGVFYDQRKSSYTAKQASSYSLDAGILGIISDTKIVSHNAVYRLRKDGEIETGLKFKVIENKFAIAPRIGHRVYNDIFVRSQTGFQRLSLSGQTTNFLIYRKSDKEDMDNSIKTKASGNYAGLEMFYTPSLKYTFSVNYSYGKLNGNQTQKSNQGSFARSSQIMILGYNDINSSNVKMSFNRSTLSFEYNLTDRIHFRAGAERETRNISYPGYFMLFKNTITLTTAAGTSSQVTSTFSMHNSEMLSDYLIYNRKEKIQDKKITLGMVLDLDFK